MKVLVENHTAVPDHIFWAYRTKNKLGTLFNFVSEHSPNKRLYHIPYHLIRLYKQRVRCIYTAYLYIIRMLMLLIQEKWMQTRTCINTYTFTRWDILTYPLKAFFGKGICKYINAIIIIIIEIRAYSASTSTCNLFSLFGSLHFEMKV